MKPILHPEAPLSDPVSASQGPAMPMAALSAEADTLMATLVATGATPGQAIGHIAAALGMDAARPFFEARLAELENSVDRMGVRDMLDEVAAGSPEAANAWLAEVLTSGRMKEWEDPSDAVEGIFLDGRAWVTSIPDGVAFAQSVDLSRCQNLTRLPEGLKVGGHLWLQGCSSFASLPRVMEVGEALSLRDCPAWDGRVWNDITVGDYIYTDLFKDGRKLGTSYDKPYRFLGVGEDLG